ncbi:2-phospho-L-lactate transferase [Novosphingobium mangrovi (ex Huang et al. 2023)]|uniref:2-phospho-L-lactate transferase n=1 Tax=Novosphingobium mangrovi (ex Huang et al. 2023) TaxID=2976432 RepID=A0ABT2I8B0_9SPHN|nr:2-phospho-L-lactate transferase [Novosphingobium mangrovi (ex Huang et al. 2023)]MCT2401049.1 2-phospho-L-lactate transferase [Novosphingobium mangrovi (ex Huang et al. 2023)]
MKAQHVLALSGGVGGAKLAAGLAAVLPPEDLTIVVNTGDDFEHLGLTICPDIDSVTYALAGLNDTQRGWGVKDETWQAMGMLKALGEADWFNLGDRDMAMHIARSWRLRAGESLSEVTARLTRELGIVHAIVPMSDTPVRTQVETAEGWLDFQRYFVAEQCRPVATGIRFAGIPGAAPSPAFTEALAREDLCAIVVCPSNPYLSVDPILAVDSVRATLEGRRVPLIAVSPLVGGTALKGPLAKLLGELGQPVSNAAIADHYGDLLDHLVIDNADAADAEGLRGAGLSVTITGTVMCDADDRERLARVALSAARIETG